MASFTDIIPKFNPYIQQLPVEAMVAVGMQKQQRYDEGIQKIQAQIEQVAGLDVVRDIDKSYLKSKLNELGSNLKSVAAGDFSNFQLVNSVSGMTKQVAKDPAIINAVSSTSWYRKQLAEMEKAISEGKSSVENIYDFNTKADAWLYSKEVNKSFKDRYTPYVDVKKKAMEAIKALHPKIQQYDIPFKTNADGSIDTRSIADAMKRYKIEGIDEKQIQQAIMANLSPEDMNQLSISAKYQFRDVTPEQLVERAKTNYLTKKQSSKATLEFLKQQRGITSDPDDIDKIDARIKYEEELIGKDGVPGLLDEQLKENIELATNNPDAVKTSLYKDGFIKEFANAFGWKNQTVTYETNPIRQQMNWVANMQLEQAKEARMRRDSDRNFSIQSAQLRLQAEANALKRVELYGDAQSSPWTPLGNEADIKNNAQQHFSSHVSSVANSINGDMARLKTKYTDAQINEMLIDWKNNGNKSTKVKPDALSLIKNISKNNNYLASLNEKQTKLRKEAEAEVARDPSITNTINQRNTNLANLDRDNRPIQVNIGGVKRTIIPSQLVKDLESGVAKLRIDKAPLGQIAVTYYVDGKAQTIEIPKRTFGVQPTGANQLRPILLGVGEHLSKYGTFEKDYTKKVNDLYLSKLTPLATQFVPHIKAIAVNKDGKIPPVIVGRLSQLITAADVLSIAANKDFDTGKASEMLLDENLKNTRVFIQRSGDDYEIQLKNEKDPKNRQVLKVSKSDIAGYIGSDYVDDRSQEAIRIKVGRGNTNLTGNPNRAFMQSQFGDFPGITKLEVTADLNQDLANPDLYIPMINVKKKGGGYSTFQISGKDGTRRLGFDQGVERLNQLTDDSLLKLLKEEYPNYDFSKLDY